MALELFPTPSWPRPSFYIPLYYELKKFPAKTEMAMQQLQQITGAPGQEVNSYWACDCQNLFFALEVPWQAEGYRHKARPWEDSLILNVSRQTDCQPAACYTSLGFAATGKKPQIIVINSYGVPFPQLDCSKIKYKLTAEADKSLFTVAVPWSILRPLRPLLYETIAINLSIARRSEGEKALFQLVADTNYDSESTHRRRLFPAGISPKLSNGAYAQSFLTCNLWRGDRPLQINLGLYNPQTCPAKLEIAVKAGDACMETHSSTVELGSGCHHWTLRWSPQRPLPSGEYVLELGGQGCGKTYLKKHPFFVIDPAELAAIKRDLLKLEGNINCLFPTAVHTALANLEWMEEKCALCTWDEPGYGRFLQAREMRDSLLNGINPLEDKPGLSRRAFRSETDGSLQTYSLYLPRGFRSERKWPLLMLLHGSCPDEQAFAANPELQKTADKLGLVLIFPKARAARGFYLGADEADIIQNLAAIKQSLPLDWNKLFLGGFAMGGFGAWHTGLRHPEHFSGLAVISGIPSLPFAGEDFNLEYSFNPLDYPDAAEKLPILVIHGTEDEIVPAEAVRELITALRDQGAQPVYKEIAGGAHGDFDWVPDLAAWLKPLLK
ncbi:MAG: PHB depolymerase family esterase [Eubacteriales bacterium]|nr:PHB depolymerase family esterase [Eubacteriales bacterium]